LCEAWPLGEPESWDEAELSFEAGLLFEAGLSLEAGWLETTGLSFEAGSSFEAALSDEAGLPSEVGSFEEDGPSFEAGLSFEAESWDEAGSFDGAGLLEEAGSFDEAALSGELEPSGKADSPGAFGLADGLEPAECIALMIAAIPSFDLGSLPPDGDACGASSLGSCECCSWLPSLSWGVGGVAGPALVGVGSSGSSFCPALGLLLSGRVVGFGGKFVGWTVGAGGEEPWVGCAIGSDVDIPDPGLSVGTTIAVAGVRAMGGSNTPP
jgi:hypothetical protein